MKVNICYYCKNIKRCNYCIKYGSVGVYMYLQNELWLKEKSGNIIPNTSRLKNYKKDNRNKTDNHI